MAAINGNSSGGRSTQSTSWRRGGINLDVNAGCIKKSCTGKHQPHGMPERSLICLKFCTGKSPGRDLDPILFSQGERVTKVLRSRARFTVEGFALIKGKVKGTKIKGASPKSILHGNTGPYPMVIKV